MTRAAVLVTTAAVFGCTLSQKVSAPLPTDGKPTAPVSVEAELNERGARVAVHFEQDATGVAVRLSGLGGLVVSSSTTPISGLSVRRGDVATFDVGYVPGPGRSSLAVDVAGLFGNQRAMRTVTFDVGQPTPEQLTSPGSVVGSGTDRVKVMPSSPAP